MFIELWFGPFIVATVNHWKIWWYSKNSRLRMGSRWVNTILHTLLQGKPTSFAWPSIRHQLRGEVMDHGSSFHMEAAFGFQLCEMRESAFCERWDSGSIKDCSHTSSPESPRAVAVEIQDSLWCPSVISEGSGAPSHQKQRNVILMMFQYQKDSSTFPAALRPA